MNFSRKKFIMLGALILLTLVLAGCQPTEVEVIKEVEVQVTVVVEPTAVPPEPYADQSAYHADWEAGPHST